MIRKTALVVALTALSTLPAAGQEPPKSDSTADTVSTSPTAQDGLYDRPFIGSLGATSVGGYLEANTNYFVEDGVGDGFSMEMRRFNIFLYSSISRRVRFLAELEFEHGTEEIALETALLDFQVSPQLTLRGGIILPPLGYLNQNHDSPKWEFVDRPFVTTDIIPSTLSEVGFGIYGRSSVGQTAFTYDAYLTNGLTDGIVGNDIGRTDIASGKSEEQFAEDNNGVPAVSGRVALNRSSLGEAGLSFYRGAYNAYRLEGEEVDEKRSLTLLAFDGSTAIGPVQLRTEIARATVDVPADLSENFGDEQWGGYVDIVAPLWRPEMRGYPDAVVNGALRLERVDYNVGTFASTGRSIQDDVSAVILGLSFRPTPGTVFRANYRYHWIQDFAGNPTGNAAGFQVGFASYF